MRDSKFVWLIGLIATIVLVATPLLYFVDSAEVAHTDPWDNVPVRVPDVDHHALLEGPFETGPEVTQACLECHEDAAHEIMQTVHWTWESDPVLLEGRDEPVTIGKKNQINNFCIGVQGNWPKCTTCHIGYGWEDENFDFTDQSKVDCLACHDNSGAYVKGLSGEPVEGVDLLAAAQSVGTPTRQNCGACHFKGGGGNAVKHGDLDESLYYPDEKQDVHMGRYDFQCVDCHQTANHDIKGRSISVSVDDENQVRCTDCHDQDTHDDQRLNEHTDTVACQTCHIPLGATREATKMHWDWSTAGQDLGETDPHKYLKIKGSFEYESDFVPQYRWYNGRVATRYILGDVIDPDEIVPLNPPAGDIDDPTAKIFPFKVHLSNQIYDPVYNILIQPKTVGEGGYWTEFDWDLAAKLGQELVGLPYSGQYDFTETTMFWPTTHMVVPKEEALQCTACHSENGRMDWEALGYPGDPIEWGGR
ncbi:MAG TPA: tetrathionate reductase family octaheme c-type cytochrome [Anaerolineae bacterium]|nr:tetrathionate reductase family octaheme c-type cytochrome [Anaerolineae bacterium]